jgi:pyridoxine 5-phosphate synthase
VRLGVNIDHIATLRNARGGKHPDPVRAALQVLEAGADSITAHLREDRRHIRDDDIVRLRQEVPAPLNLEMAAADEMLRMALHIRPHACCIVPERRQELTTEGGLDAAGNEESLKTFISQLGDAGIRVSLFIDAEMRQIEAAYRLKAPVVEFHTGRYCDLYRDNHVEAASELRRLRRAVSAASSAGLEVHAGHGLDFETAAHLAAMPEIKELNIGHFLVGEAVFSGLGPVIRTMRDAMDKAKMPGSLAVPLLQDAAQSQSV